VQKTVQVGVSVGKVGGDLTRTKAVALKGARGVVRAKAKEKVGGEQDEPWGKDGSVYR
jgi:hypothetical protein